jgi:hypothetical protein
MCEAGDETYDTAEIVRTLPGNRKGTITTGRGAGDGAKIRIGCQIVRLAHFGQDLFGEKARIAPGHRVVFVAAIEARLLGCASRRKYSGIDEDADRNGHFALVDEIVEDDRGSRVTCFIDESPSILKDHYRRGFRRVILRRRINPVVMRRAGIDGAGGP